MSDVFVSPHTPTLGSGRALRAYAIIRALALGDGVDVVYARFGAPVPAAELVNAERVTLTPVDPSRGPRRALAFAAALARGVPADYARGISPELRDAARRHAAGRRRVIADGPIAAAALLPLAGDVHLVYNAHNIESSLSSAIAGDAGRAATRLARFERRLLDSVSETWLVSDADLKEAAAMAPNATLRYVPNAVDVNSISPVVPTGGHRLLFTGDFSYPPNRVALAFLTDEVMPRVWAEDPDARLLVTGRGLAPLPDVDPRIERLGFVDDLDAVYAACDCVVVPLMQSGGSPLKFVEAMAHALPVVATSTAARGLAAEGGVHFLEADGAEAFAAAVVAVLRHGAPGIAAAGRALAEREYSVESLARLVA